MRILRAVLLIAALAPAAASAEATWNVTVTARLPDGRPAAHAFVRMYYVRPSDYRIVSLQTKTTDANGSAIFKARAGASFKAEFGTDSSGRSLHVGGARLKDHETAVTIDLD